MPRFASPRFLRIVLVADAASCVATGAAQVFATAALAQLLNMPAVLLAGTGWFLLGYAAVVAFAAARDPLPRAPVRLFLAGNLAWGAGCAALLASGAISPTPLGVAWVIAQAVTVLVLADLQWLALRGALRPPRPA